MTRTIRFATGAALGLALACLAWPALAAEESESEARMRKDLTYLSGDECEGRGVETKGIKLAADFVAAEFKKAGLKPGGVNGTYFQPFEIAGPAERGTPNTLTLFGPQKQEIEATYAKQFMPLALSGSATAKAGVVFVGFGITANKLKYDDYKDVDVAGKIVMLLRRAPRWGNKDAPFLQDDDEELATFASKVVNADQHKAAGVLMVNDAKSAANGDDMIAFSTLASETSPAKIPVMQIKRELADRLLVTADTDLKTLEADIERDLKPHSFAIPGWTAEEQVTVKRKMLETANVIGVLDGAGPLADETIVFGAHYDHLGYGEVGTLARGEARKAIHHGADDNGSGTTSVIELARRFAAMKDRQGRRLVFMTFSGEERGLLGSVHYCDHPVFPLDKTVAMVNLDMVGRYNEDKSTKKNSLELGGIGSAKSFESFLDELNKTYDFKVTKSYSGYGPSDHQSFYKKGVPVLFFFTGYHDQYHRPTDTVDHINFAGMKKIVDLSVDIGLALCKDEKRPEYVKMALPRRASPGAARVPTIGFAPGNYDENEEKGVLVGGVTKDGPAEKAGLKEGDYIVEIAGKPVKNMTGYMFLMRNQKAGEACEFAVMRDGKKVTLKVVPQ
jgi:hypothetical protein